MELSWLMKLRIAAAIAVGVVLIGILAWPMVAPATPFDTVTFIQSGPVEIVKTVVIIALVAFFAGFLGCLVSWPYGREIGVLSAPAGLAVWAVRTGSMADLLRLIPAAPQRQAVYAALKWEGLLWLAVVAAGFCGVLLAQKITTKKPQSPAGQKTQVLTVNAVINAFLAVVVSVIIAHICISLFAKDVQMPDSRLGSVLAQPAIGQIVFAVVLSFGLAAFTAKRFLDAGYIWPIAATAVLTFVAMTISDKSNLLQYMANQWPAAFFGRTLSAILPVQLIAFGTLGALAGYWLAVRHNYWRQHREK